MAHYAYLDENNIVTQVIDGKDEKEDDIDWEEYYGAIRTSYNTTGGVHLDSDGMPSIDQSKAFRYNYAGIGMIFLPEFGPDGAFVEPQPFPSWILNLSTALWEPPILMPTDGEEYDWDEDSLSWVQRAPELLPPVND